ncbi:MAG: iron chaperone [Gemmatimonadota bacterium]
MDAYLASLPTDSRSALQQLRKAIAAVASGAEEGFSYGLPAFRLQGRPLVCYGASRNHCSFYPMSPAVIEKHARDLKAYDISKGTIRFSPEKPLPLPLLRKLVKARIAELQKAREVSR